MDIAQDDKFGWIVSISSIFYFASPIFHFINLFKGRIKYDDTPGVFVLINYFSTYMYFVFGMMLYSTALYIPSLISCIISGLFLLIYLRYEIKEYFADSVLNFLILVSSTWAIYRALAVIIDDDDIVYYICLTAHTLVYLAPLQLISRVLKENNYNLFPIQSAYVALVVCPLWIIYSIKEQEYPIIVVYAIGIISSITQIIIRRNVKARCGKELKDHDVGSMEDEGNSSTIGVKTAEADDKETESKSKAVKITSSS